MDAWGRRPGRPGGTLAATLLALALAMALAGCGSDAGSGSDAGAGSGQKVRLVVQLFAGEFGFKELYEEYKRSHPNVEIVEQKVEIGQHHEQLATRLAAGSGAGDVVAIEEGWIAQFKASPDKFNNLLDYGAAELKDQWLPWKWQQSLSGDGSVQIGLGTDVGGMAMCYRTDLLAKAGLPTDRDQVSKLWPTWDAYIETGKRFMAAGTGPKFFDAGANLYAAVLGQQPEGYYSSGNHIQLEAAGPRTAWDVSVKAVQAKLSAGLGAFSPEWNAGFQQGGFATIACPAWMMGYIQGQAPDTSGKWDIAAIPEGRGNWGGSFLTVPKQSKYPREAYELAKYLTSPESERKIFQRYGLLPSQPALFEDTQVKDFKNPFFSDAPVGQIFTTAAKSLQPQYQGPKSGAIRTAFTEGIHRVELGQQSPDQAYQQSLRDAQAATR